jgi:hypothetical protein
VSERSKTISRLLSDLNSRTSYIKAKIGVLVPSQIRALRLTSNMPRQADLAREAKMQQSRISMFETPGAANMTLETLSRVAAAFRVGLVVKFVPFSEMLRWENRYSQDTFDVVRIEDDEEFITPDSVRPFELPAACLTAPTITELQECGSSGRTGRNQGRDERFEGKEEAANGPELQPKKAAGMAMALGLGAGGGR